TSSSRWSNGGSWSGGRPRPRRGPERGPRSAARRFARAGRGPITGRRPWSRGEDDMKTVKLTAAAPALSLAGVAPCQALAKPQLTRGVGGTTALYYLPLTICERLGYFKEQGLDVAINDFRGGAQSLQALVGGSVDVVTGAYEHTIRMQAKGQD